MLKLTNAKLQKAHKCPPPCVNLLGRVVLGVSRCPLIKPQASSLRSTFRLCNMKEKLISCYADVHLPTMWARRLLKESGTNFPAGHPDVHLS